MVCKQNMFQDTSVQENTDNNTNKIQDDKEEVVVKIESTFVSRLITSLFGTGFLLGLGVFVKRQLFK